MPRHRHGWWFIGLTALLAGCAHGGHPGPEAAPDLALVGRGAIEPDLRGLPDRLPAPAAATAYHALTPAEAQCLAARATSVAKLLDIKQRTIPEHGQRARLGSQLLIETTAEARNKAAGEALTAYYQLVEAEGRLDLLTLSLREVNESLARAEELQAKGLRPAVEPLAIRTARATLGGDEGNLRVAIAQLNGKLRAQLGLGADTPIWPVAPLLVGPDAGCVEDAIETGLRHRPDVATLRLLADNLSLHTVSLAQETLATVNPALGPPSPMAQLLLVFVMPGRSLVTVREQIATLRADTERQAAEEIRTRFRTVELRLQNVAAAQRKLKLEEERLAELEEQKAQGINVESDLSTHRLSVWKARGDLLREVVAWEIARVQLRQAQGLLHRDCEACQGE